jgi:TRIAP1/MDM35 family protein
MSSISPECDKLKQKYDSCFNSWYTEKYLKGKLDSKECDEIFQVYKACVWKNIKAKNIDKLIADASKDTGIPLPEKS